MFRFLVRRHALSPPTQLRRVFFFSAVASSSTSGTTASSEPHLLVEYLVNTCGFSADDASKVSKSLPRCPSTEKADAVVGFFRSQGLDGANLRKQITWRPYLLGYDVETVLAPKFNVLRDMGFSESDVVKVLMRNANILSQNAQNTLLPRLKAWERLFGSREILLRNLLRGNRFMSKKIENVVRPNFSFLRDECGIPADWISLVVKSRPSFIAQSPDALRALVDRADGIGVPRKSKMFLWILNVLTVVSREKFEAQIKLMNSFGWSNSDFTAAMKKHPTFLFFSTELLQKKMEFFTKDVEIEPSEIAKNPMILKYSLEKRSIPRFQLMKMLKSEGLWTSKIKLPGFFSLPGPKFLRSFVLPYEDKLPKKLVEVL